MLEQAAHESYPGGAVLVAKDGEIVYQGAVGLENIKDKTPIELNTKFRIGSVTKQFTASAILKLQEQGKLSVHDKLSTYYPDFPRGDQVTIHHLLTHTSGIHSFTNTPDFLEKVVSTTTPDEMLKWIASLSYDFDPGDAWSYNNSGYYLLGLIIEKVNGKSFGETLADFFFEPLEMNNTGVHSPGINLENEAIGYQYENGDIEPAVDWNMDFAGGAGNLYSTVIDLYKWNKAVFNGNVLSEASKQMAFTPVVLNDGEQANALGGGYGYGWIISTNRGLQVIQHTGGLNGFNSSLSRFPEHHLTIVVLSNALPNIPNLNPSGLTSQIAELYLYPFMEKHEPQQVATDFDPTLLDDYVGRYDYQSGIMTIRREGDQLFAQLSGQQEYEIYPSAKDKFFWKVVDAQIEFKRDETGTVTHAIHKQNNTEFKVAKLKDKKSIQLPVDVLQKYEGTYELAPNVFIKITQEGKSLYAQVTGQPKLEIFPSEENIFFYKDVNAQLTFNATENGAVKSVTIKQGAVNSEADKISE
jgi:CubicO group peptidase (beta-lactamase class C family)